MRKRAVAILAAVAMFAAVLGLSRMAATPDMSLLYSGLDDAQAGEVVQALDQQGALYDVRGTAIYVDAKMRDQLRMTMASSGLPSNSSVGYELLDGLSGFGTTSQMFDAAYWRAKEGELARTIVTNPSIRTARVHIANSSSTPFRRSVTPTASVSVTTSNAAMTAASAKSLRFLVASAVAGLSPQDVSIIDATTGQVVSAESDLGSPANTSDRAATLKANVQHMLEARVGPGNAIVEVSVETVTERESIRERRFDPQSRVAISTDVEEVSTSETNTGGANVTVASNVPDGAAADAPRESQSQNSETRERTNFEVSETTREITRAPGSIKRLTVAVLLNGVPSGADDGAPLQPRPAEELAALQDLVASAVGFDETRGDVITIKSLEFDSVPVLGTEASDEWLAGMTIDPMRLIQLGVLSLVALVLGLFVVRPILAGAARRDEDSLALALDDSAAADADQTGLIATRAALPGAAEIATDQPRMSLIAERSAAEDPATMPADSGSVSQLKRMIEERQPDTIEILRSWLEDDTVEENA